MERRRNLTDAERAAEDAALGLNQPKEKAKWRFMQKYYHKGAFYMDDESIRDATDVRLRAADAATGEDKFDIAALPKVMQVKAGKFGRAGQTKYTHLLDQVKKKMCRAGLACRSAGGCGWVGGWVGSPAASVGSWTGLTNPSFTTTTTPIITQNKIQDTTKKTEQPSLWQQSELDRKAGVVAPVRNRWAHQLAGTGEIDAAGRRKPKK